MPLVISSIELTIFDVYVFFVARVATWQQEAATRGVAPARKKVPQTLFFNIKIKMINVQEIQEKNVENPLSAKSLL